MYTWITGFGLASEMSSVLSFSLKLIRIVDLLMGSITINYIPCYLISTEIITKRIISSRIFSPDEFLVSILSFIFRLNKNESNRFRDFYVCLDFLEARHSQTSSFTHRHNVTFTFLEVYFHVFRWIIMIFCISELLWSKLTLLIK